jgi:serine protease inhibitor
LHEGAALETRSEIEAATLLPPQGALYGMKALKDNFECATKKSISTKNAIFFDKAFHIKPKYVAKVLANGGKTYKLDFANDPDGRSFLIAFYC